MAEQSIQLISPYVVNNEAADRTGLHDLGSQKHTSKANDGTESH